MKGTDKSGRRETKETRSGDDGCRGGRWRRWMTTVADNDNGNGGRRQWRWRTTTAANDDSGNDDGMQDRVADYEGEGGQQAANKNGIRARWAESVKK